MSSPDGYTIDAPMGDEMDFIIDAWTRSFRDSDWAGCITNDKYQETARWTITSLVARGAKLRVAVNSIGPRRVLAFACFEEPNLLHYVYVKKPARGLGLCTALLAHVSDSLGLDTPGRFTHRTRASSGLLRKGWRHWPAGARIKDLAHG